MAVITMAVISQESSPHRFAGQDAIPRYRWVVIGAMASGVSTSMAMLFFIGLLLPDISKELGLSPTMQGLVGSSALITNLVLVMPINTWSSRFKPRRMLAFALFLVAASVFIQARAPVFAVLLLGRGCLALGTMFTQAPRVLLIQQWSSRRQLAMTNGILVGSVDLMMGIVSFLTPLIVVWTGDWRSALNVWGFVCLALMLVWMVLGRNRGVGEERRGVPSQDGTPLKSVLKYRELWYASIGLVGVVLAEMAFSVFWADLGREPATPFRDNSGSCGRGLGACCGAELDRCKCNRVFQSAQVPCPGGVRRRQIRTHRALALHRTCGTGDPFNDSQGSVLGVLCRDNGDGVLSAQHQAERSGREPGLSSDSDLLRSGRRAPDGGIHPGGYGGPAASFALHLIHATDPSAELSAAPETETGDRQLGAGQMRKGRILNSHARET